jgi:hypothetical protein
MTAKQDSTVSELPPDGGGNVAVANDVYPLLSGGWRATCECGLAISLDDEPAGWTWVIDHICTASTV